MPTVHFSMQCNFDWNRLSWGCLVGVIITPADKIRNKGQRVLSEWQQVWWWMHVQRFWSHIRQMRWAEVKAAALWSAYAAGVILWKCTLWLLLWHMMNIQYECKSDYASRVLAWVRLRPLAERFYGDVWLSLIRWKWSISTNLLCYDDCFWAWMPFSF